MTLRTILALTLAALTTMAGAGCATSDADSRHTVTVFAAASLTEVFKELAVGFEAANPGTRVVLQFAGSQSLRAQIEHGAEPNVFASANTMHMNQLRSSGLVSPPVLFARNELVIVVPRSNPADIRELVDLPRAERLVLAGEAVPAGSYTRAMLDNAALELGSSFRADVLSRVVSRELNVRQVLQKVLLGEADASIVYATDAAAAGEGITIIRIPAGLNVTATYPIAEVVGSHLGASFVDFVRSTDGADVLEKHGFQVGDTLASR